MTLEEERMNLERIKNNLVKIYSHLKSFGENISVVRQKDNMWSNIVPENSYRLECILRESSNILAADCEGMQENIEYIPNISTDQYIYNLREHSGKYIKDLISIGREIRKSNIDIYSITYINEYVSMLYMLISMRYDLSNTVLIRSNIGFMGSALDNVLRNLRYANSYIDSIIIVDSGSNIQNEDIQIIKTQLSDQLRHMEMRLVTSQETIKYYIEELDYLSYEQLAGIRNLTNAVTDNLLPNNELENMLKTLKDLLNDVHQEKMEKEKVLLSNVLDSKLDISDKLKITIPIIPLILSYEGIIELKSGMNLKTAWTGLLKKVRDMAVMRRISV